MALFALSILPTSAANANVNAFSYAYWGSDYTISLDANGRSHAHVVETLVARFPDYDQNRGIVRGLDTSYLGASLNVRVLSITDENGNRVPYETENEDGTLYLLLGTDDYVHGLTTYVIEYEMRDVMIAATETGRDEFYWNLLPLRSSQMIEEFVGTVTFTGELAAQFTGDAFCYQGYYNSTELCGMTGPTQAGSSIQFQAQDFYLPPGWGYTFAIGFRADTVTQPVARTMGGALDAAPYIALGVGGIATVAGGFALASTRRRARTATGIIIAHYAVSPDVPPLLATPVAGLSRSPIPAQMVHLAVNGVINIESFSKSERPRLNLVNPDAAHDPLDKETVKEIFDGGSSTFTVPKTSTAFANKMRSLTAKGVKQALGRGYLSKQRSPVARVILWVVIALVGLAVIGTIVAGVLGRPDSEVSLVLVLFIGAVLILLAFGFGKKHNMHTEEGALLYEHLQGLREFIRVAEADRLRVLQSVTGAESYQEGSVEIVHIYEKLLPYAMLFGEEKSWGKVLETAYQASGTSPLWFHSSNHSGFSSQLSSFASTAGSASSYTPPSSSSSSGGSGGGGFSGGGGGGGFSGGR